MFEYKTLTFEQQNRIATITLNRPEEANGLNTAMAAELLAVSRICNSDSSIKVVILTGSGRFFSAGGDIKEMQAFGSGVSGAIKQLADQLHESISLLSRMNAPLVVAVNGTAAGAGFSLSILGDYVIAAESAVFTLAYTRAGLCPDGSSSYFLPRLVGLRKAQELMLTNRVLSAEEALDWGLVNCVVSDETLMIEARTFAEKLVNGSLGANACVKKLLLASAGNSLETQMDLEAQSIAECAESADGQEGIAAFVEKRKPQFTL